MARARHIALLPVARAEPRLVAGRLLGILAIKDEKGHNEKDKKNIMKHEKLMTKSLKESIVKKMEI